MRTVNFSFVTDSVSPSLTYGNAVRTLALAKALSLRGHRLYIICSRYAPNCADISPIQVIYIHPRLDVISWASDLIQAFKVFNCSDASFLCLFWDISHFLYFLFTLFTRSSFFILPNGSLPPYGNNLFLKSVYLWIFGSKLIKESIGFFAVTHREMSALTSAYSTNTYLLPNGLPQCAKSTYPKHTDSGKCLFPQLQDLPSDAILITYLGRISYEKGVDLLVQSFLVLLQRYSEIPLYLLVAGPDFGLQSKINDILSDNPDYLDRLIFIGPIRSDMSSNFLSLSSIHVVPSRLEAMSMVALEAARFCNGPILVTYDCGIHDFNLLKSSFLFCESTTRSILASLSEIIHHKTFLSPTEASFTETRRRIINDHFSWSSIALRMEEITLSSLKVPLDT